MAYIRVISGVQAGQELRLGASLKIGRDEGNGLRLWDESASRYHCEIYEDDAWKIRDLGSRNGTEVNGKTITNVNLQDGDRVRIGSTVIVFSASQTGKKETVLLAPEGPLRVETRQPVAPPAEELTALGIARDLSEILDLPVLLDEGLHQVGKKVEFDRGTIVLSPEFGLSSSKHSPRCRGESQRIRISTTIVEQALEDGESLLLKDASADARAAASESVVQVGIVSAICSPLRHGGKNLGFLYLDRLKGGAPFTSEDLRFTSEVCRSLAIQITNARRFAEAQEELARITEQEIIGESPAIRAILQQIRQIAPADHATLITGETGTGKELVARALHRVGSRSQAPFIPVNCAALPETIIESELFGHEKGAFTGAMARRAGKFELAADGVLFLDEIGELPIGAQAKFLRVLEDGEVYPVGASKAVQVDVRVVAATNRNLEEEVRERRFREDLFFRLKVLTIDLPPLRDRPGDIPRLAAHFLQRAATRAGKRGMSFADDVLDVLTGYAWPGNVRELQNLIERAVILSPKPQIGIEQFPEEVRSDSRPAGPVLSLAESEKITVLRALEHTGWKKGATAKLLGVSWPTLNKKIRDHGIQPPDAD